MISAVIRAPIWAYRMILSPVLPAACRFEPSCSRYALDAIRRHGPVHGSWLAIRRIARCHPWGGCGYDPVP
jgi:putative membrane protein insertion efficiency factor